MAALANNTRSNFPSDHKTADVILRTVDHVDFHAHRVILAHASPFFHTMFTLPQSSEWVDAGSDDSAPVVNISEDSNTLDILLTICYPFVNPRSYTLDEVEPAIRAALKYEMALPVDVLRQQLSISTPQSPFRVWAIACRAGLEDVARAAAGHLLGEDALNDLDVAQLEGVSAGDYFRLCEFWRRNGGVGDTFSLLKPSTDGGALVNIPEGPTLCAAVPFTDVVCRSSDGEEIPAHRAVLAMSSPLLRARLVSLAVDGTAPSPPVLEFDEQAPLLRLLLDTCYRSDLNHVPTDPSIFVALSLAAQKHGLEDVSARLTAQWASVAKSKPLNAYIEAAAAGQTAWAKTASRYVLDRVLHGTYDSAMESCPARSYHRLLQYYDECGAAVDGEAFKVRMEWSSVFLSASSSASSTVPHPASGIQPTVPQPATGIQSSAAAQENQRRLRSSNHESDSLWTPQIFFNDSPAFAGPGGTSPPGSKVVEAQTLLNSYIRWRGQSAARSASRKEARAVLVYASTLSTRLEDAINEVCVYSCAPLPGSF